MIKQLVIACFVLSLTACGTVQKVKYSALEKVGVHKRDVLVDRIEKVTDTQQQTKQQFESAYQQFSQLVKVDDAGLEDRYKKLSKTLQRSEDKKQQLDDRINAVEEVANALFAEWKQELDLYQNKRLRSSSETSLQTTQAQYKTLLAKMHQAQKSVTPVLNILQDNTLFLKHNLNARAVNSLQGEVITIQGKVQVLIEQMQASINESERFLQNMQGN